MKSNKLVAASLILMILLSLVGCNKNVADTSSKYIDAIKTLNYTEVAAKDWQTAEANGIYAEFKTEEEIALLAGEGSEASEEIKSITQANKELEDGSFYILSTVYASEETARKEFESTVAEFNSMAEQSKVSKVNQTENSYQFGMFTKENDLYLCMMFDVRLEGTRLTSISYMASSADTAIFQDIDTFYSTVQEQKPQDVLGFN